MLERNKPEKQTVELFKLTENCYDNLETANALLNLLCDKFKDNRNLDIVLSKTASNIQNAIKLVLEIQNNI